MVDMELCPDDYPFYPKPYILLNLILSFIAAFQAPVILMSQNRAPARDKRESLLDFAINYKAETEIDDMQAHLHTIEAELAAIKKLLMTKEYDGLVTSTTNKE